MNELPSELLKYIMELVPIQQLKNMRCISHTINSSLDNTFWKNIFETTFGKKTFNDDKWFNHLYKYYHIFINIKDNDNKYKWAIYNNFLPLIQTTIVTFKPTIEHLYYAASCSSSDIVKYLLQYVNPNRYDKVGAPLFIAAKHGNINNCIELLKGGATHNYQLRAHNLLCVATESTLEVFKLIYDCNPDLLNSGHSPLYFAAKHNQYDIVKFIIEKNFNVEFGFNNLTPLYIASEKGYYKIVKLLLENGANVNAVSDRSTALYIACENGHKKVVKILLEYDANYDIETFGAKPLYIACKSGHDKIVKMLCKYIDINVDNQDSIFIAFSKGHIKCVKQLVKNGINISMVWDGFTPLSCASINGHTDIVRYLIKNGADVNFQTKNCYSPLFYATKYNRYNVITLLKEYGALE